VKSLLLSRYSVLLILSLALLVRLAALFVVDSISHPELWEYEEIANNLLEGEGLHFTFMGVRYQNTAMILYPLICAGIYLLTEHSFLAVKFFQIAISLLGCFMVYKIAARIFGNKVAIVALALVSFHPGLVVFSVRLHALTLDIVLFAMAVYFFILLLEGKEVVKYGLLAGVFIGAAMLTRSTIALTIPIAMTALFVKMKSTDGKLMRSLLSMSIGIFIILSPLFIRNNAVFGKPFILPNDSAPNFWAGNNPNSVGTGKVLDGKSVFTAMPRDLRKRIEMADEFEQRGLFYGAAYDFIKTNPQDALKLFFRKFYYFWWVTPTQGQDYPIAWFKLYKAYYSLVAIAAMVGLSRGIKILSGHNKEALFVVLLFCLTIAIAQSLYCVEGRHRWSIEPFILIFAANGVTTIKERLFSRGSYA